MEVEVVGLTLRQVSICVCVCVCAHVYACVCACTRTCMRAVKEEKDGRKTEGKTTTLRSKQGRMEEMQEINSQ